MLDARSTYSHWVVDNRILQEPHYQHLTIVVTATTRIVGCFLLSRLTPLPFWSFKSFLHSGVYG